LYIGYHNGSPNDGYICSSKRVKEQIALRPMDFTRQIIAEGYSGDMYALESQILKAVDARNNPEFYNGHNNESGWTNKGHTEETRKKIGHGNKGKVRTEEFKQNLSKMYKGKLWGKNLPKTKTT
jgi:hypothetical protein